MNKLPKKFPEYLILYKTFANQIKLLEKRRECVKKWELKEINAKIENYQSELIKIRRMFPDKFFEEIN
jgi:hypothetical protein